MSLSISGGVVGTPAYIAPEVWDSKPIDKRVDIYALGCILYEMVTGRVLFIGDSGPAIMMAHFKPLDLPHQWPKNVPDSISEVLHIALSRDPASRYPNAGEMARDLGRLTTDKLTRPYLALEQAISQAGKEEVSRISKPIATPVPDQQEPKTKPVQQKTLIWVWFAIGIVSALLLSSIGFVDGLVIIFIVIGAIVGIVGWLSSLLLKTNHSLITDISASVLGSLISGYGIIVLDLCCADWTLMIVILGAASLLAFLRAFRRAQGSS